ncbi:hypothetical protein KJ819_01355 [Patescibacteria group bacterium]|nr:hypothetical protein [Patescibacteria group bacterium]MBU1501070.1 hypothetical protein [Patescibacteria group bacterium]MBU2081057.1 hypothetical protein [Patescibacteria group bacterium]MBU2124148.1 hypothetical protein [Patescibacteria group bacterium]MBU2195004.1 hypothetical protein [Patescibacteria group bacterium]
MENISFDEEQLVRTAPLATKKPALVELVLRWKLAKDQKSAEILLISVAVIAGVLALTVPLLSVPKDIPPPQVTPFPAGQ